MDTFKVQFPSLETANTDLQTSKNTFHNSTDGPLSSLENYNLLSNLSRTINDNCSRFETGYQACYDWLDTYSTDLMSLEESLAGFKCGSLEIEAPLIFNGRFEPLFDNRIIPILNGSAKLDSNQELGELGERVTEKTQKILDAAYNTGSPGGGLCAMWVSMVHDGAGLGYPGGNANDMYWNWCTSSDRSEIQPGMIIAVPSHTHTSAGSTYGHVGIYMGNGMVRDNIGYIRDISLDEWINYYSTTYTPKWGFIS